VVPAAAETRGEGLMAAVLAVEHHAEGAALALLVLADLPGMLRLDVAAALHVADDVGTAYGAVPCTRLSGLGSLQTTAWLTPAVPPAARTLEVRIAALERVSVARGGTPVVRPLSGGPWDLRVDLTPARTGAPPPPPGSGPLPPPGVRIPARALGAYVDRVPVGQARLGEGQAVCLWCLERYVDRAVLSLALLADAPSAALRAMEVWDDRGARYRVTPLFEEGREGWTEAALELTPSPPPAARTLAVRVASDGLDHVFGVALGDGG